MQKRLLGLIAVPALVVTLSSCGSDDSNAAADPYDSTSTTPSAAATTSDSPTVGSTPTTSATTSASGATCTYRTSGTAARPVDPPSSTPTYTDKVQGVIETSTAGTLHITLNGDTTPCAVNSFASLASQGFYDNTPCPRITTQAGIFEVLQCGDPSGTTAGGPGYEFDDELSGSETYPAGTLAMANAGPDTNGSQFFICYGDTSLPPSYDVFGSVAVKDLAKIKAIGAQGSDNSNPAGGGKPKTPIDITKVTVG